MYVQLHAVATAVEDAVSHPAGPSGGLLVNTVLAFGNERSEHLWARDSSHDAERRGVIHPPPFPHSITELTADVLSTGLGTEVADFTATRIGADRGMLGEIFVLDLTYPAGADGGENRPERIVAKFAADREGSLASAKRGGAHERELRCFTELLTTTPVTAPRCHGAWYDPDTAHFLLLQSAIEADDSVDQVAGITIEDAQLVLAETAKLHATWWRSGLLEELPWLPPLDGARRIHNLTAIATNGWDQMTALLGSELSESERALGAEFSKRLERTLRHLASLPTTLVHSDLRADNLLFAPDHRRVTLIDWQGCGVGPPSFDLAYFLSQSLTVDDRRTHEADLLGFYRDELAVAGLDLGIDEITAGYGEAMHYGLAIACALPLISDPEEPRVKALASVVARRSIEALRDHNQLWETS